MAEDSSITRSSTSGGSQVATVLRGAKHYQSIEAGPVTRKPFSQFLSSAGDGTGTFRVITDYSGGSTDEFYIQPGSGEVMVVTSLHFLVADTGSLSTAAWVVGAALTNGIELKKRTDPATPVDVIDFFNGQAVKTFGQMLRYADIDAMLTGALAWGGSAVATFLIDFHRRFGTGIRLSNADDEYLGLNLNDDFTGLDDMTVLAHGYYENDGS